jgi:hypothetical protein
VLYLEAAELGREELERTASTPALSEMIFEEVLSSFRHSMSLGSHVAHAWENFRLSDKDCGASSDAGGGAGGSTLEPCELAQAESTSVVTMA